MIRAPPSAATDGRNRHMVSPNCVAFDESGFGAPDDLDGFAGLAPDGL
jgi:hypothetical protein